MNGYLSLCVFSLMLVISKLNQHRSHKILTGKSSRYSSAKSLYLIPDPRFPDPRSPRVYPWYSEADDAFTRRLTHVGFLAH